MGLTFKENCADIRNSGINVVIKKLKKYNCIVDLYDPWAHSEDVKKSFNVSLKPKLKNNVYDGVVIAVAHDKFKEMGEIEILKLCKKNHVVYDLKHLFSKDKFNLRL